MKLWPATRAVPVRSFSFEAEMPKPSETIWLRVGGGAGTLAEPEVRR